MADFKQAVKWLKEGKKVKRKNWRIDDVHLFKNLWHIYSSDDKIYNFDWDDITTNEWMIYGKSGINLDDIGNCIRKLKEIGYKVNKIKLHPEDIVELSNSIMGYQISQPHTILGLEIVESPSNKKGTFELYYQPDGTLSDKRDVSTKLSIYLKDTWFYYEEDVKEKVQKTHSRLKTECQGFNGDLNNEEIIEYVDKIFQEEFGDKLIEVERGLKKYETNRS